MGSFERGPRSTLVGSLSPCTTFGYGSTSPLQGLSPTPVLLFRRTPSFGRYQAIDAMGTLAKFDEESARVVSTAPGILQLLVTSLADAGTAGM